MHTPTMNTQHHLPSPSTPSLTPTASLISAQASIMHQLYMLECRGHDARDMQRTLNYINAELRMREVENLTLQEASKNRKREGEAESRWIKKKDGGARLREMEDEDKRWEKVGQRIYMGSDEITVQGQRNGQF